MSDELELKWADTYFEKSQPFVVSEELQKAIDGAVGAIKDRPFSGRNPHLGKMINCPVCDRRHRQNELKCEQQFTYRIGDYELFREEKAEDGTVTLVPDFRTAIHPDKKPTMKQYLGQAAFNKKRLKPHLSKMKLLFVQCTRKVFEALGFDVDTDKETFEKNLQTARKVAQKQIWKEFRAKRRLVRQRQQASRRINRGFSKARA